MIQRRTSISASLAGGLVLGLTAAMAGTGPAHAQASDPPTTPDNIRADVGASSVTVQWDPSTSDAGVTIYFVQLNGQWRFTVEPRLTLFLQRDQAYQLRVQAQDAAFQRSDWSDPFEFTTPDQAPVTTPSGVQVTESPGGLMVAWGASSSDAGVLDYTATVTGGPGGTVTRRTSGTSATFDLPPGGEVDVTVQARDRAYRLSDRSAPVGAVVPPADEWAPPGAPSNLRAAFDSRGEVERVAWDAASGGSDRVTYHLKVDGDEIESTTQLQVELFSFAECTERDRQRLDFTVTATSNGFESPASEPITLCFA
jgi:hypothetical protein